MTDISQLLKDDTGQLSSMRLILLVWGLGTFIVWAYLSIDTHTMSVIPSQVMEILGMVLGGKVFQSFSENQLPPK